MTLRNPGRLAIHRRSDEIAFLQHLLRTLNIARGADEPQDSAPEATSQNRLVQVRASAFGRDLQADVLLRKRDLADELLHTRQIEPLGETLQRRLAMAERICRDLVPRNKRQGELGSGLEKSDNKGQPSDAYWVAEIERLALTEMLKQWWAWLQES